MNSGQFQSRVKFLSITFVMLFIIFGAKLFSLQVIQHDEYFQRAKALHEKRSILPARRGKILVKKNHLSDELTPLATNNSLKMLFVDPLVMNYPGYNPSKPLGEQDRGNTTLAAKIIAPLLIHAHCDSIEGCFIETDVDKLIPTEALAIAAYEKELEKIFNSIETNRVILATDLSINRIEKINNMNLPGIWTEERSVLADPTKIVSPQDVAKSIAKDIGSTPKDVEPLLRRKVRRYIEVTNKILPEVADQIMALKQKKEYRKILRGIQLRDEHWRYYPERSLAAQIIGFVDSSGDGQYGIEGRFDQELRGKEGLIYGATSAGMQFIGGGDLGIQHAQDGADIVLSIDRIAQGQIEKILMEDLEKYQADSGQIVVIEPQTGRIIAMAHAPTFDPNQFGESYARYEISPEQEVAERSNENFNWKLPTIKDNGKFYRYYNSWGPEVFRAKAVTDMYEPGSVMKAVTVAAAINSKETTAKATYEDDGPIEVLSFEIKNADGIYDGTTTILEGLITSRNTMIAFLTKKMGAQLTYEYLRNFGFGQYTDIELDGENEGRLEHWRDWDDSELITRGFGQGITASPLQMAMAFSALANGGYLMQPILVDEVRYPNGEIRKYNPEKIRRVITQNTYQVVKAMLKTSVDKGYASGARVPGYTMMGKTGTSQTYDSNGKPLEGEGNTITSFGGFGPYNDPKFVVLVKYDYPRASQWGSETAAKTFSKVAQFMVSHLSIPPDKILRNEIEKAQNEDL